MDKQEILKANKGVKESSRKERNKKEILIESARAIAFGILGLLLNSRDMLFDTSPLGFALLASSARQAPFIFLGITASALINEEYPLVKIIGGAVILAIRIFSRFFLDKKDSEIAGRAKKDIIQAFSVIFSEHTYLKMMSGAVGVFFIGIWKIIVGGFRFYDLFGAIFYLILTPVSTLLFSWYFDVSEEKALKKRAFSFSHSQERLYNISSALLVCAVIYSLKGASIAGISAQIFIAVFASLFACKKGVFFGVAVSLGFGISISPTYAPMCALCVIAFISISKLSLFGASVAACIGGLVWAIYTGGLSALAETFPALLSSSMIYCTAERVGLFSDIERFLEPENTSDGKFFTDSFVAEQKASLQDEKLRAISDSFSALSEIFYNLSSKLKRPTMLDLRKICEKSFDDKCAECENREVCFGAEYGATLDAMKKITVALHSSGIVDEKKLPDVFKKRCPHTSALTETINRACAIETKKAFQNEKTEIFALDYDAISKILNDAIAENEDEFKIDTSMSKKLSKVIADEGYGEHSVSVFGKRKLKILARGLDLSERASDVSELKKRLEDATRLSLVEPTFELAFGSVNMQTEAKRAFSVESAFATETGDGEKICGDTVSIFENKNDYLYALISDGMGKGHRAAFVSEMCNVFLRNMLNAGNRMETSLKMLNSVVRTKGADSASECSATVDLLQFDLYSGALTLIKSGAAPTFVMRRGNVFKLGAPSLPIGILRALDAKQIDIACEDGDMVIMISDGAAKEGDDCSYLVDMLKDPRLADDSASRIAEKLLRRAKAETAEEGDDISVVVLKVKKELCKW